MYVVTKTTPEGYLLFFSDRSHVHVSAGRPEANSAWHRLDGRDASQGRCEGCFGTKTAHPDCNKLFLHVDPHAFAVSSDFDITLSKPVCTIGPPAPYDQNSVLASFLGGTMWMANDGGVYRSIRDSGTDGGFKWELGSDLATLQPQFSFAGVALPDQPPALYLGVADNDSFFTLDGGDTWRAGDNCGDCGPFFQIPHYPTAYCSLTGGPELELCLSILCKTHILTQVILLMRSVTVRFQILMLLPTTGRTTCPLLLKATNLLS